jgi:hypothetical protein
MCPDGDNSQPHEINGNIFKSFPHCTTEITGKYSKMFIYLMLLLSIPVSSRITTEAQAIPNAAGI